MEKIVLKNGLRILLLPIEGARSASVGIWVATGSRNESEQEEGISHFIEHMLFKGTHKRSSRAISEEMDRLGGGLNAYTAKEYTRYYAQTLSENAVEALDILVDMVMNPRLDPQDMELERGVILDEMAMYEDSGEDVAHERLLAATWPDSSLGKPILGRQQTVSAFQPDDLRNYMHRQYTPDRMIVVVGGAFDREGILSLAQNTLGTRASSGKTTAPDVPVFTPCCVLTKKTFEQTSLVLAMPGIPMGDQRRYALMLLNFIVGGGASSRLFQRLREELGLAYSVYSSHYASQGVGLYTVTASFSADQQELVLRELLAVLDGITGGITQEEFERALAQVKASHILGLETVASRSSWVGHNEMFAGREIDSAEVLEHLDALTLEDVNTLAAQIIGRGSRALSVAGDVKPREFYDRFVTL